MFTTQSKYHNMSNIFPLRRKSEAREKKIFIFILLGSSANDIVNSGKKRIVTIIEAKQREENAKLRYFWMNIKLLVSISTWFLSQQTQWNAGRAAYRLQIKSFVFSDLKKFTWLSFWETNFNKVLKVGITMIVLVFLAAVLLGFAIQFLIQRKKFYKFSEEIPSPKSFGLLGHAPYFLGKDEEGSTQIYLIQRRLMRP